MIRRLLVILLLTAPAWAATTYYVDTALGNNANSCATATSSGASAKKTITGASGGASCLAAGDTLQVAAGDYSGDSGWPYTLTAGSAGAYKTVQCTSGTCTTKEWILNSHTKLVGFTITDSASPNSAKCITLFNSGSSASTDIYVTGNTLTECGNNLMMGATLYASPWPSNIYIQNNTFSYGCTTAAATPTPDVCQAIRAMGDRWLIEGNDFSHITTAITLGAGSFNVIRNNTQHDIYGRDLVNQFPGNRECVPGTVSGTVTVSGTTVTGSGFGDEYPGTWIKLNGTAYTVDTVASSTSLTILSPPAGGSYTISGGNGRNCHITFFDSQPSTPTQKNLIEGNRLVNMLGNDTKGILAQGFSCAGQCSDLIIRENVGAHIGSAMVLDNNNGSSNPGYTYVKSYNNTWADVSQRSLSSGITNNFSNNSANGANINDIFYYPVTLTNNLNPYAVDASSSSGFAARNNIAWVDGGSSHLKGQTYNAGSFTDNGSNQIADPKFTLYSSVDASGLTLQVTSAGHLAGASLTTVNGTVTNSATVVVADGSFFSDGLGLVNADWLCFGDTPLSDVTNNCRQISSRSGNTLTMVSAMTIANGAKVWLYKDSNGRVVLTSTATQAPNIGAYPDSVSPSAIAFADQQTSTTSAAVTVTLSNWSTSTLAYTSAALTTGTQFAISNNTCSNPIAASSSCSMDITFTPTSAGAKTDTLTLTDGAGDSPQTVALSGTGIATPDAPTASLACTPTVSTIVGQSFTCTPTVTNATYCLLKVIIGSATGLGNHAENVAMANCTDPVAYATNDIATYTLYVRAEGAGGTVDSASVGRHTQKAVSAAGTPY